MGAGIWLIDQNDVLIWSYKKNSGSLSAKDVYDSIVNSCLHPVTNLVDPFLWSSRLSAKISCFIWLALRNKILTWENLQKKGY